MDLCTNAIGGTCEHVNFLCWYIGPMDLLLGAMKGLLAFFGILPAVLCGFKAAAQRPASRFSIVISPALFVPVTVAVQGGVQFRAGKMSVMMEGALPTFRPDNTEYEKIDYWRSGIEFKYFLKADSNSSKYVSLQGNYMYRELMDQDQAFYYTRTQTFSYTNALIKSPVFSSALKIGVELNAGKRTYVDAFIGAGVRFIFTEYQTKNALVTSTEPPKQNIFKFDDAWKYNYTLVRPHAAAGIRFGVRL